MELSVKEEAHKNIMEVLAKECRSNKKGFIEGKTGKIDEIRSLMLDSGYHEILLPNAQIWRKNFDAPIAVIVSSHADVVDSITKCSSKLKEEDEGLYYNGTYDNAGTNAALVISALEGNLPDNAIIAFTADEESGRCNGAKQVLEYARSSGFEPVCIALDVTYEGYDEGFLFTVENASSGYKKDEDMDFLNSLADAMVAVDQDEEQGCCFVKLSKNGIPDKMDQKYLAKGTSWLDEAQIYGHEHARTFSLCLPCDGEMHENRGVLVKEPVFEGYVNALEYMIFAMSKDPNLEQVLNDKKTENAALLAAAKEMADKEEKARKSRQSSMFVYESRSLYEDDYFDYLSDNGSYYVPETLDDYRNMKHGERMYKESWYDEEIYPTFSSYVDCIIEEIVDSAYSYSPEEKKFFIEDSLCYMPDDVIEWFGGIERAAMVIDDIYTSIYGLDAPDKKEHEEDRSLDSLDKCESINIPNCKMEYHDENDDYEDDFSGYYDDI